MVPLVRRALDSGVNCGLWREIEGSFKGDDAVFFEAAAAFLAARAVATEVEGRAEGAGIRDMVVNVSLPSLRVGLSSRGNRVEMSCPRWSNIYLIQQTAVHTGNGFLIDFFNGEI